MTAGPPTAATRPRISCATPITCVNSPRSSTPTRPRPGPATWPGYSDRDQRHRPARPHRRRSPRSKIGSWPSTDIATKRSSTAGRAANPRPPGHGAKRTPPSTFSPASTASRTTSCASPTTCASRSTTTKPNATSAWSNSARKSAAAYAPGTAPNLLRHPQLPIHRPQTRPQRPGRPHPTPHRTDLATRNQLNSYTLLVYFQRKSADGTQPSSCPCR